MVAAQLSGAGQGKFAFLKQLRFSRDKNFHFPCPVFCAIGNHLVCKGKNILFNTKRGER
jgi:hypothetical protein